MLYSIKVLIQFNFFSEYNVNPFFMLKQSDWINPNIKALSKGVSFSLSSGSKSIPGVLKKKSGFQNILSEIGLTIYYY